MKVGELKEYPDELLIEIIQSNFRGMIDELYEDCGNQAKQSIITSDGKQIYKIRNHYYADFIAARRFIFNTSALPELIEMIVRIAISNDVITKSYGMDYLICQKMNIGFVGDKIRYCYNNKLLNLREFFKRLAQCIKKNSEYPTVYKAYSDILKIIYSKAELSKINIEKQSLYPSIDKTEWDCIRLIIKRTDWTNAHIYNPMEEPLPSGETFSCENPF